jgi:hypothetical protein
MRKTTGGLWVFRCFSYGGSRLGPQHNLPGLPAWWRSIISSAGEHLKVQSSAVKLRPERTLNPWRPWEERPSAPFHHLSKHWHFRL